MKLEKALSYRAGLDRYVASHKKQFLSDVSDLCRINSEKMEAEDGMPFGPGAAECLDAALDMAEGYGFSVTDYDGYVGTVDYDPQLPAQLDILAHLDVVPAGTGWTQTRPFSPLVKDGRIYGRGTSDDKGPAVAALYAMRAVKKLGVPVKKNIRLILGTDEECGSSDIVHYYAAEKEAPMTFSPDAAFPLVNTEKGRLHARLSADFSAAGARAAAPAGPRLVRAEAGVKVNVVPGTASALVAGISGEKVSAAAAAVRDETGIVFQVSETGGADGAVLISAAGKGVHGSLPQEGNNALTGLLVLLSRLPLSDSPQTAAVKALLSLFPHGDVNGKALGLDMEDELSGKLTLAFSMLKLDESALSAEFDSRIPVCGDGVDVPGVIRPRAEELGLALTVLSYSRAHHVPGDSEFVRALLSAYEAVTGQKGGCVSSGGGTYVHELKNGVAFGAVMPGTDTRMHGADEFAVIDELLAAVKIFALAIIQLCA